MSKTPPAWAIIVHGGAKEIAPDREAPNQAGCLAAVRAGQAILAAGGSALDAVEAAIRVLEDDPTFNAGFGSVLNADGKVEMDAALMDGATLDVGGVAAITGVRNPIVVARRMLRETPTLLVAEGARRFAETCGAELCDPDAMIAPGKRDEGHDTVGCVALDRDGNIVAGTSTGGLPRARAGRVGDSPIPGCGLFADSLIGGVSLSGDGESIVRTTLAARAMRHLETAAPDEALADALTVMDRVSGEAGIIAIDRHGRTGWAHNCSHFAVGMMREGMTEPMAWTTKSEERSDG